MQSVEVLKKLVSYPTITPKECGIYAYIREILPDFEALEFEKEGVKNLFLYKKFGADKNSNGSQMHLCFGGHIDVVPAGEGWESEPFTPTQKGEYLIGRGTQDMKGGVAAFLCAIREFVDSRGYFSGILSVLLTSDEEGEAIFGTKYVLEELQKRDLLPNYAIVAEPTSVEKFGDMIKIGRRGSINGKLTIFGKQGHVAYPSKCINPVELIAPILPKIAGFDMDSGSEEFEPSKIVVTDIRGGMEVVNVTPNDLKMMFNIRNSPKTSLQDLENHFREILSGIPHHLELKQSSKPFLTDSSNLIVQKLIKSLQKTLGITPLLSTSGGTSDARYFAEYGINVVECGVCNDTIHSLNERVKIREVEELKAVFLELLEGFGEG